MTSHAQPVQRGDLFGDAPPTEAVGPGPFRPIGAVCALDRAALRVDDKVMDLKVLFSKAFPFTTEQFLPVAEVMARTGRHAENLRAFFNSKMPEGAGFPVQFTIPVFPTVTAKITFELCEVRRSPARGVFELPADYKMGAYSERGWIRQL